MNPSIAIRSLLAVMILTCTLLPKPAAAEKLAAAIVTGDLQRYRQAHEALEGILATGGYDATKLKLFVQTPNADKMSLTNSIRRSVAAGAEILITYGASATLIAAKEAKDTTIIFADVYDPLALGIIQNMAAPGVNRSGSSCHLNPAPLLEKLQAIKPGATIGILLNENEAGASQQAQDIEQTCQSLGLTTTRASARNVKEIGSALEKLATSDVLFVTESVIINQQIDQVMAFAGQKKIAVVSTIPGLADQGALLTLEADPVEQGTLAAVHALQVLAGQKAFMLPVREPKKISLNLNLKKAAALNLTIPEEATRGVTRSVQ